MAKSEDAPYEQSRAALRRIYGTRRIDASAPYAKQDTTPSARFAKAKAEDRMGDVTNANEQVAQSFNNQFQPRPIGFGMQPTGRPTGWSTAKQPTGDQVTPEQIANYQSTGIKPGFFETPYGMVGVTSQVAGPDFAPLKTPSEMGIAPTPLAFNLSTPSPLNASALAPYAPKPITSYTPPWKRNQQVPSFMDTVLNGASKWLS